MNSLFRAAVRLASSRPVGDPLRRDLLRLLTADVPAERGREEETKEETKKKGPPPMWKEFLDARYEGGKAKVQNTNPDTKDRYKQVSMTTRFKSDKQFQESVYKEYREWMKKQKGDKPSTSESKPKEPEEPKVEEKKKEEPKKEKKPLTLKDVGTFLSDMVDDGEVEGGLSTVTKALAEGKPVSAYDVERAISLVDDLAGIHDDEDVQEDIREAKKVLKDHLAKRKEEEEAEKKKSLTVKDYGDWLALTYGKSKTSVLYQVGKALYAGKDVDSESLKKAIARIDKLIETAAKEDADELRDAKKALEAHAEKAPKPEPKAKKPKPADKPKPKPKFLANSEAAWNAYGEQYNEVRKSWSVDQKDAVRQYTGSAYLYINSALRQGNMPSSYKGTVEDLDTLFDDPKKGRVLQEVMVARGAGHSHPLTKLLNNDALEVGMEFVDKGYVSGSIKPWASHTWKNTIKMNIHVPEGARGIYVGSPPGSYSSHPNERELLLDRNVKMRVTGFNKTTRTVELEVVV